MIPATALLVSSVNQAATDVLKAWIHDRRQRNQQQNTDDEAVDVSDGLSEEQAEELVERISNLTAGRGVRNDDTVSVRAEASQKKAVGDALSRSLIVGVSGTASEVPASLGGVALSSSPEFFATARHRIALVFRLSVGLALVLAFILFGGIAVTIASGLMGHGVWSVAFGGVSAADLLGIYAYKPLAAISEAVVASQRLEIIHMRLSSQLAACAGQPDLNQRLRCQTTVWNTIQKEITAMSAASSK